MSLNQIQLSKQSTPGFTHAPGLTDECAAKASELLTLNHTLYHTRFNGGFHNHIAHHILALWAIGATPQEMQDMWEYNKRYQEPLGEKNAAAESKSLDMGDTNVFEACLGVNDRYADFLRYFKEEIAAMGAQAVIKEYVLKGDDRANDIFCRLYTDLVHPMIHLGYAIEFNQPSLVAETLAAACVHDSWPKDFLLPTEELVRTNPPAESKSLLEVQQDLRDDKVIASAVREGDPFNKIRDGLLKRVGAKELSPHLSKLRCEPTAKDIQQKLEDMMYAGAYTLGAAQRNGKQEAIDFVLLHNVTLAVFYPAIIAQDWLSNAEKARLLETKARMDAVTYAACACPELQTSRITDYRPSRPQDGWPELLHRASIYRDEGHIAKGIRALYSLEPLGEPSSKIPVSKRDFFNIAHMVVDSTERAFEENGSKMPEPVKQAMAEQVGQGGDMVVANHMRFVFYGGLAKAWQWIPDVVV